MGESSGERACMQPPGTRKKKRGKLTAFSFDRISLDFTDQTRSRTREQKQTLRFGIVNNYP